MPDSESEPRKGKISIEIPKPATGASGGALRDESSQYGDEVESPPRRRKRTDARVPIVRGMRDKAEKNSLHNRYRF